MDLNEISNRVPFYFHTNGIGSVTATTNQDGNVLERVSYDMYGMPTFKDYITDPQNPTIVENSVIGNDILFQGRRYDKETNLYYFRARYYDPIMGRFLQTDPMGYQDSMNLYQALNMNPINLMDPLGLAIINVFIGTEMNEANAAKLQIDGRRVTIPYPDWDVLNELATQHGHTLNIFTEDQFNFMSVKRPMNIGAGLKVDFNLSIPYNFSKEGFEESIKNEEVWTFYLGHSLRSQGKYVGLRFGQNSVITRPRTSNNKYIGIFGCSSFDYASKIFPSANLIFSIKDRSGEGRISSHRGIYSAYFLIRYLITTNGFKPNEALKAANKGLLEISKKEKDRVVLESPKQNKSYGVY